MWVTKTYCAFAVAARTFGALCVHREFAGPRVTAGIQLLALCDTATVALLSFFHEAVATFRDSATVSALLLEARRDSNKKDFT